MPASFTPVDREAIYVGLFNWLQNALQGSPPTFTTMGRRHIMPPALTAAQQPALFVCGIGEEKDPHPRGTTGKITLTAMLFLYDYESGINEPPGEETSLVATRINAFLAAIDAAIAPPDCRGVQTLGGLVNHCWIDGRTDIDPGLFGQQAAAIIPVKLLVP
jgi:hypothetical protein